MSDSTPAVLRLTAFASEASGGNPAGVVLDASALSDPEMQRIAADRAGEINFTTRFTSPNGAVQTAAGKSRCEGWNSGRIG